MRKTKIVLLSALVTLALFASITGCKRSDDTSYGNLTFWNTDLNEDIVVTVDNYQTETITKILDPIDCNTNGCANFYLSEGTHYYTAYSKVHNYTWSNSVYVDYNTCKLLELYR